MNENEPNEFDNTMKYTNINSAGIVSRTKIYQPGLSDTEKRDIIAYLQNLIDIVENNRVRNVEIKISKDDIFNNYGPSEIKIIDLMIRFV